MRLGNLVKQFSSPNRMRQCAACIAGGLLILLVVAPGLFADGTIRYESRVKFGPAVAAVQAASKTPVELTPPAPSFRTMHFKNGKLEQDGTAFSGIYDSKSMQITLVDTKRKVFAATD